MLFSYLFFNMHQVTRILSGTYSLPWINTLLLHLFAKYLPKSSNDCLKLSTNQIPPFSLYKTSCFCHQQIGELFFFNRKLIMFNLFVCKILRKLRQKFLLFLRILFLLLSNLDSSLCCVNLPVLNIMS